MLAGLRLRLRLRVPRLPPHPPTDHPPFLTNIQQPTSHMVHNLRRASQDPAQYLHKRVFLCKRPSTSMDFLDFLVVVALLPFSGYWRTTGVHCPPSAMYLISLLGYG